MWFAEYFFTTSSVRQYQQPIKFSLQEVIATASRRNLIKAPTYEEHLSHAIISWGSEAPFAYLSVCLSERCHHWLADRQLMETDLSRRYRTEQRQTSILSKNESLLLLLLRRIHYTTIEALLFAMCFAKHASEVSNKQHETKWLNVMGYLFQFKLPLP